MNRNLSFTDQVIRVSIGLVIAALYFMNMISGIVAIVLGVVAVIFIATSFINFCPLYYMLGISSFSKK